MTKQELQLALYTLQTRGQIKRFAKQIESEKSLLLLFQSLMEQYPYVDRKAALKKQIRMFLDRSQKAQIRKNPIFVDEAFQCENCGKSVPIGGVMIRDHCPFCLWGRHLDNVPGDRASTCGGMMEPQYFSSAGDTQWIHYSCTQCSHEFRVRAHPDDILEC